MHSYSTFCKLLCPNKNFTGNWQINHDQSDFGKYSVTAIPVELTLQQSKDALSFNRTNKSETGDTRSYTENLPFSRGIVTTMLGTTQKKSSVKWSKDQQYIIETANYSDEDYKNTAIETLTLSEDGKTLTVARVDDGNQGHSESKIVYNKK